MICLRCGNVSQDLSSLQKHVLQEIIPVQIIRLKHGVDQFRHPHPSSLKYLDHEVGIGDLPDVYI